MLQSIAIIRPDRWFVNLNFMSTDFPLKRLNLSIKLLHWKDLFFLLMILMMSINSLVRIHFFKALALGITGIARHLKLEQMSLLHPDLYITWKKTFFFFCIRNILQSWNCFASVSNNFSMLFASSIALINWIFFWYS